MCYTIYCLVGILTFCSHGFLRLLKSSGRRCKLQALETKRPILFTGRHSMRQSLIRFGMEDVQFMMIKDNSLLFILTAILSSHHVV